MRVFITQSDIENLSSFQDIDISLMPMLVESVNIFMDDYIMTDEDYGSTVINSTTKLAGIKLAKHWGNLDSNIKSIKDIDVSITFNTDNEGLTLPPNISSMLKSYKKMDNVISGTNSLSFF